MYAVIEKNTENAAVFKENKALSEHIGCSVGTISNKRHLKVWDWKEFRVYKPSIVEIKSKRGGKRTKNEAFY